MVVYEGKLTLKDGNRKWKVKINHKFKGGSKNQKGSKAESKRGPRITGSTGHYFTYRKSRNSNF